MLTDDQESKLVELCDQARGGESIHPINVPLGYRGFLIDTDCDPHKKGRAQYAVCKRVLTLPNASGKVDHWLDTSGVERFLLALAVAQGNAQLLERYGVVSPRTA